MIISEQVLSIEKIINSKYANYSLMEKVICISELFDPDPIYSKEATDIVRSNLVRKG